MTNTGSCRKLWRRDVGSVGPEVRRKPERLRNFHRVQCHLHQRVRRCHDQRARTCLHRQRFRNKTSEARELAVYIVLVAQRGRLKTRLRRCAATRWLRFCRDRPAPGPCPRHCFHPTPPHLKLRLPFAQERALEECSCGPALRTRGSVQFAQG